MTALEASRLSHPKYRPDIDGLRAIAVLAVVAYHLFPSTIKGGFIGVDVFFVISGFLISTIIFKNLDDGTFSFGEFYTRRIKRIFPALLLVLIATYVFGWFDLLPDEYKQLGKHITAGAGFFSNIVLWNEAGYFDNSSETKPLLHLWSLGVEEQFYIVWPIVLWLSSRTRISFFWITLLSGCASFYLNFQNVEHNPISAFYSPLTRFWELTCGSILAWVGIYKTDTFVKASLRISAWLSLLSFMKYPGSYRKRVSDIVSLVGIMILIYGFFRIDSGVAFPGSWALVPVLGAMLILSAGLSAWVNCTILSSRFAVQIGLISFPLYLWHWPLLSFSWILSQGAPPVAIRIAVAALSIVLAWLTYGFIERPMRLDSHGKTKAIVLSLLMASIGCVGYKTYSGDGFVFRKNIEPFEAIKSKFSFSQDMGRPNGAKIMLLGDSHAGHLVPGLKKEMNGSVADYTSTGCIPFYDVDRYDSRFTPGACANSMNDALSRFEKDETMTGIIISSAGPIYLTGKGFKWSPDPRTVGLGVELLSHPEVTDHWEVYSYGLRNTLMRLTAAKKKILFVIDIPELGFDPKSCFDRRPFVFDSRKRSVCAVSRADYDDRAARYKSIVYSIIKEFPGVEIYDPTDDLCDQNWCWAIINETIIYRDPDHLTSEGSDYLVRRMMPLIDGLM